MTITPNLRGKFWRKNNIEKCDRKMSRLIVFYTGYSPSFNPNDKANGLTNCYGSELCTKNIAECLASRGYAVHIFSTGNETTSECQGVMYHNFLTFNSFQTENEIDVLVISRYINIFVYSVPRARKIFFWSHDVTVQPFYDGVAFHGQGAFLLRNIFHRIDKYIALTQSHLDFILNDWLKPHNITFSDSELKKFVTIGNGINKEQFHKDDDIGKEQLSKDDQDKNKPQRVKNRFIYSSHPSRGLEATLNIIQRLYAVEPSVTLHVFHSDLPQHLVDKVATMPYVTVHGKVEQCVLIKEMMMSEFWLYPTHFFETHCMTALECQMAGVIPIVRKYGGLVDTVGNRGIQVEYDEKNQTWDNFCDNMYRATLSIMNNKKRQKRYRMAGSRYARQQTYSMLVEKWIAIIEEKDQSEEKKQAGIDSVVDEMWQCPKTAPHDPKSRGEPNQQGWNST